ncbi:MAG: C1 family peptidase [Kiritimatiellae bacterium]|nr:C1 family peptidase [Verrucomicrobiota bacterium]MBU4366117.1 C1 family peptidase [Verrucomicrobiota bacterium]MCG2659695.1 C1 family peptidase [Kiritimatiellia bacterium]
METRYKLGWLPDVPDTRDIPFTAVFRVPRKLPARADLRAGCSPVEDQESLGSCTAQALVGALEFLQLRSLLSPSDKSKIANPKSKISRFRDLSRLFVYYNERAAIGTVQEDSGAMLRTGIKTLKAQGVCRECLWPYAIRRFTVKPTAACFAEAADHQVTAYQRLNALAEMKACLAMGLPFVFGFAVYEHVMSAAVARTGRIRLPGKSERMLGGHAVMAVGYQESTRMVLFRNSWGVAWGQAGCGQMPYAYLESRELSDDFWCIQGTESNRYAAWKHVEREA